MLFMSGPKSRPATPPLPKSLMPSALFSPIRLSDLELQNRVVVSPMCQYSANDGCATDWHLGHLGMLANSGAAMVVVEATHVERHGRITHGCLGLYSDANELALTRVMAHCRSVGTAKSADPIRSFVTPAVLMFLMFVIVMSTASPLLNSVMEEKMTRLRCTSMATARHELDLPRFW